MKQRDLNIYKAYLKNKKVDGGRKAVLLTSIQFKVSRTHVYNVINLVEYGDYKKLNKCFREARLECIWKNKYKFIFSLIPKDRKKQSVISLVYLIKRMADEDEYTARDISKYINKKESVVAFHLRK